VKLGEIRSTQEETRRLDGVLVRDDDHVAMRVGTVQFTSDSGHPVGDVGDLLFDELQALGMIQVSLQLSGEAR
jgi:hypothetical protein